ncbi:glycosyltransferase [Caulobacter sp. ErkDOM-YI]|uniref:glycosyltransferase n=1 Tax=unclassified Caulobacter TaxID=2648921 RepID=UPI003AF738E5
MARYLFTTWEGGGHVQPLLLAARDLQDRGHAVLILSDVCNDTDAAALGVAFQPWTTAPSQTGKRREDDRLKDHEADNPLEVIQRLIDRIMAGPALAYAQDTLAAVDAFKPDAIVSQELLLGAMAAAEARNLPLALFAANIWSLPTLSGVPPFGAGMPPATSDEERAMHAMVTQMSRGLFQIGLPALNTARAALGLPALDDLFGQLDAAGLILIASSRAFDFAPDPVPAPFAYAGPYLADPAWVEPATLPAGDAPLVLVSFSSLYQAQEVVLSNVIVALGRLPVRGLVTTGPTLDPSQFPAPDNVIVVRSAPHEALLDETAVFVTHAGHGSTLRPLMAGVPLLCMPMGRDQHDNAARVVARDAGLRLSPDASVEAIMAAITALLEDVRYGQAAAALGAAIQADRDDRSAATLLELLLAPATSFGGR